MPFVVACDLPQNQVSPRNGKGKERAPLRPVLGTITPTSSPSSNVKRTPLGEKKALQTSPGMETSESTEEEWPRFPSATINADSIGAVMAARLVACLLGHVLFLKSQIPLPVAQLVRISSKATERQNKKMDALLSSFDILCSQLGPTFAVLSLALSSSNYVENYASPKPGLAKTHMVFVLGPSVTSMSTARARVVLEIDGLRLSLKGPSAPSLNAGVATVINAGLKENSCPFMSRAPEHCGARSVPRHSSACDLDLENENDGHPPDSDSEDDSNSSFDANSDEEESSGDEASLEAEADISRAECSLSRVLAISNADPELGMAAETRPTQMHILLRAPRRFSHPSWIPRQILGRDMDSLLHEFEEKKANMGMSKHARQRGPGVKTDYVRIRSRGAVNVLDAVDSGKMGDVPSAASQPDPRKSTDEGKGEQLEENVEDKGNEMIWWSWDGRLEGFAEL